MSSSSSRPRPRVRPHPHHVGLSRWAEVLGTRRSVALALLLLVAAWWYFFVYKATIAVAQANADPKALTAEAQSSQSSNHTAPSLTVLHLARVPSERVRRQRAGRPVQQRAHAAATNWPTVFDLYHAARQNHAICDCLPDAVLASLNMPASPSPSAYAAAATLARSHADFFTLNLTEARRQYAGAPALLDAAQFKFGERGPLDYLRHKVGEFNAAAARHHRGATVQQPRPIVALELESELGDGMDEAEELRQWEADFGPDRSPGRSVDALVGHFQSMFADDLRIAQQLAKPHATH